MAHAKAFWLEWLRFSAFLLVPALIRFFNSTRKGNWHGLRVGRLAGALHSPLFWIEVFVAFALFLVTSRLGSKAARVLLCWIPAIGITSLGCAVIGLLTLVVLHFGRQ
jgi:hypothetical protein